MLLHIETAHGPLRPTGEVIESDAGERRKMPPRSRRAIPIAAIEAGAESNSSPGDCRVERLDADDDRSPDKITRYPPRTTLDGLCQVQLDSTPRPAASSKRDACSASVAKPRSRWGYRG